MNGPRWTRMLVRPLPWITLAGITILLAACGAAPGTPGGDDNPDVLLNCVRDGYPCTMAQVDPETRELESDYVAHLSEMLDTSTFVEALAWVQTQPQVVLADADESSLVFRLEGSQPVFMLRTQDEGLAEATETGPLAPAPAGPESTIRPAGVVGDGTARDNPGNRKRALFLEPFEQQGWTAFAEPIEWVSQIHDYGHADGFDWFPNELVTPEVFGSFATYDAIFIETHGAQFPKGTWISTGILAPYDKKTQTFADVCKSISSTYESTPGVQCGVIEHKKTDYVTVGLLAEFFQETYGKNGGLDKAIIYVGGCKTLTDNWDLAEALSGSSTAYLGWNGNVNIGPEPGDEEKTAWGLLWLLAERRKPVSTALEILRLAGLHEDRNGTRLKLYDNGSEPGKLRLYDLPSLKDPANPTGTTPLQEGASLRSRGTPGDGEPDGLDFVVDVTGVIDPDDTGGGIGVSQASSAADKYNVAFYVNDEGVGFANLGDEESDRATVTQVDDVTYRMTYRADLPFDVAEDGTDVTLRVEVSLPEGGFSDFEVDVELRGVGCEFHAVIDGFNQADIFAYTTRLTDVSDYYEHGTADAILAADGSNSLVAFSFDGPALGENFSGWVSRGSRAPIPEGATGTFEMVGSAGVGGEARQFNVISGPLWWEPDSEPLQLTITEFSEDTVVGTITGNVWDIDADDPPPSFLSIDFTAMTTDNAVQSSCYGDEP